MRKYLLISFLLILLILPAFALPAGYEYIIGGNVESIEDTTIAGGVDFTADEIYAIHSIQIDPPGDSSGTFYIKLYNQAIYSGNWTKINIIPFIWNLSVTFNGETIAMDTNILNTNVAGGKIVFVTVLENATGDLGILCYVPQSPDKYIFVPVALRSTPMAVFQYESTSPDTWYHVSAMDLDYYMGGGDVELAGGYFSIIDLLKTAWDFGGMAILFIGSIFYWVYFIFVENFLLIVALFEGTTVALAANSKDIFTGVKKWWKYQIKLMDFMLGILHMVFSIAQSVRDTFLRIL